VEEERRNKHHLAGQDQRRKPSGKIVERQIFVGMEVSAACKEVEYELGLDQLVLLANMGDFGAYCLDKVEEYQYFETYKLLHCSSGFQAGFESTI
jgi:hypothetical protein